MNHSNQSEFPHHTANFPVLTFSLRSSGNPTSPEESYIFHQRFRHLFGVSCPISSTFLNTKDPQEGTFFKVSILRVTVQSWDSGFFTNI